MTRHDANPKARVIPLCLITHSRFQSRIRILTCCMGYLQLAHHELGFTCCSHAWRRRMASSPAAAQYHATKTCRPWPRRTTSSLAAAWLHATTTPSHGRPKGSILQLTHLPNWHRLYLFTKPACVTRLITRFYLARLAGKL